MRELRELEQNLMLTQDEDEFWTISRINIGAVMTQFILGELDSNPVLCIAVQIVIPQLEPTRHHKVSWICERRTDELPNGCSWKLNKKGDVELICVLDLTAGELSKLLAGALRFYITEVAAFENLLAPILIPNGHSVLEEIEQRRQVS